MAWQQRPAPATSALAYRPACALRQVGLTVHAAAGTTPTGSQAQRCRTPPGAEPGPARSWAARAGGQSHNVQDTVIRPGHKLLCEALTAAGVEMGVYDHRIASWLAGWEPQTCAVVAGWLTRAGRPGTAPDSPRERESPPLRSRSRTGALACQRARGFVQSRSTQNGPPR
jgi:hypothetical protein